jgi:hypothetical protein
MKTTNEQKRQRLAGKTHARFGAMVAPAVPGTVFDPLPLFFDPGRFRDILAYFRGRAARAGVGSGLPRDHRAAALDEAAQRAMRLFTDRDYGKMGLMADDAVAATLSAARYMERCGWRDDGETEHRDRPDRGPRAYGNSVLFNRAQATRAGFSPAAIHATARGAAEDTAALVGYGCDDVPGETVDIPGGPSGRGPTDGRMERVENVIRERVETETDTDGKRRRYLVTETVTGWRMNRGRGMAETLPPARANAGRPAPLARFVKAAPPVTEDRRAVWTGLPFSLADEMAKAAARREADADYAADNG